MALLQRLIGQGQTFAHLAKIALDLALREGRDSGSINVVFDVYREVFIKNAERRKRGSDEGVRFKTFASGHEIRQWRKLLPDPYSRSSLIRFLIEEWKDEKDREHRQQDYLHDP
ncbi:hypothetical protein GWK47_053525 [Chionoecetes opilio]|uniref:Uncharacterized protein n=1 Tax=Chionoecetes opilio TaxID=41210 RepID=A0A8J4Y6Y9_CHIOP|nr:hypothetical protein GWK47_053525 [Chionoecetes opilio]